MKPYSEDLRMRIVKAVEQGTSKSATARLVDVSLSSVKRYMRSASRGESLAPGKGDGRPPKGDRTTQQAARGGREEALGSPRLRETPLAGAAHRQGFERLHHPAAPQATQNFSQKRSVGVVEPDEFLRTTWREMVSGRRVKSKRFVFVDEIGANT